jgi:hypothetical protein
MNAFEAPHRDSGPPFPYNEGASSPHFKGNDMATFEQLKTELDAACESLRGFTLGHSGISMKRGRDCMKLVSDLCDTLGKLPTSPGGRNPASLIAVSRGRIRAAEARLALLTKTKQ